MSFIRKFHRIIGVVFALSLFIAVLSGLLWAYSPYLYLREDYSKKKHAEPKISLSEVTMSAQQAMKLAERTLGDQLQIKSVTLRSDFGRALYEVVYNKDKQNRSLLIDAKSSEILSPLSEELAAKVANQYLAENVPVEKISQGKDYVNRGKIIPSVFFIRFQKKGNLEMIVDRDSGALVEELDDAKRFHAWVMQFHQLNFFGFKKTLTIIPGAGLIMMLFTGLIIWRSQQGKRSKIIT
jgi:uncharacterized iron-regulated membrane protein